MRNRSDDPITFGDEANKVDFEGQRLSFVRTGIRVDLENLFDYFVGGIGNVFEDDHVMGEDRMCILVLFIIVDGSAVGVLRALHRTFGAIGRGR